jgi:hypothetical protein
MRVMSDLLMRVIARVTKDERGARGVEDPGLPLDCEDVRDREEDCRGAWAFFE